MSEGDASIVGRHEAGHEDTEAGGAEAFRDELEEGAVLPDAAGERHGGGRWSGDGKRREQREGHANEGVRERHVEARGEEGDRGRRGDVAEKRGEERGWIDEGERGGQGESRERVAGAPPGEGAHVLASEGSAREARGGGPRRQAIFCAHAPSDAALARPLPRLACHRGNNSVRNCNGGVGGGVGGRNSGVGSRNSGVTDGGSGVWRETERHGVRRLRFGLEQRGRREGLFERDGRLALVVDAIRVEGERGGHGVEQAPTRGRERGAEAGAERLIQEIARLGGEVASEGQGGEMGGQVSPCHRGHQVRIEASPGLASGEITAEEGDRLHRGDTDGRRVTGHQKLGAPEGAIVPIAKSVERDAQHRRVVEGDLVLGQTRSDVGVVVLDGNKG